MKLKSYRKDPLDKECITAKVGLMSNQPNEQFERNEALFNDWKGKQMKMWELIAKYHISVNRIYFIVHRMLAEENENEKK